MLRSKGSLALRNKETKKSTVKKPVPAAKAKTRKPKEVTVVELSSSEEEVEHDPRASGGGVWRGGDQNRTNYDPDEPIMILSSDEEQQQAAATNTDDFLPLAYSSISAPTTNMYRYNPLLQDGARSGSNKQKKPPAAPAPDSSSDDDLIVVKTEPCTIDPITKKQIEDPVRNKKCNHIYEKSTIYGMIDQARENSKSVRCPYMGCNQKDFKKTDLVKDKDVAKHLGEVRDEKEKADIEKAEKEQREKEARQKRREDEGEQSADSIVEEVIEMIRLDKDNPVVENETVENVVEAEEEEQDLSAESHSTSAASLSPTISSASSKSSSTEEPQVNEDVPQTIDCRKENTENSRKDNNEKDVEPEKSKRNKGKVSRKVPKSTKHVMSDSSDSDTPLSRVRSKRKKRAPRKLDDSFSGSEFDEENSGDDDEQVNVKIKKVVRKPQNKKLKKVAKDAATSGLKIIGKKVTETWSIEKQKVAGGSKRKDRKRYRNLTDDSDLDDDDDDDIPTSRKGKSSSKRPPKNASLSNQAMEVQVPKRYSERAKKVFYAESDDDF